MTTVADVVLDTGLVGAEDITEFMRNTLTSPTSTTRIGAGHRKQLAFRIDTAPTLDNLTPFERYFAFGFAGSNETWAKNASLKAAPLTVRVGTTGSSVSNPNGFYRLRWNHNATDFDTTYQVVVCHRSYCHRSSARTRNAPTAALDPRGAVTRLAPLPAARVKRAPASPARARGATAASAALAAPI